MIDFQNCFLKELVENGYRVVVVDATSELYDPIGYISPALALISPDGNCKFLCTHNLTKNLRDLEHDYFFTFAESRTEGVLRVMRRNKPYLLSRLS